jgi:hypothetical protein
MSYLLALATIAVIVLYIIPLPGDENDRIQQKQKR